MSPLSFTLVVLCILTVSCQDTPDLKILVGDMRPGIHQVSLRDERVTTFGIQDMERPIAIDFDTGRNELYWTDVRLHQISKRNLWTLETQVILAQNESSTLDGIAVDTFSRKVFYTNTGYDVIGKMNTDGTGHEVIIDTGLDEPRAIVLYEERRQIYWTDWGYRPYIASASYEGTDITKIVTTGLDWPNGLALDKQNGVLYWCDGKAMRIEAMYLDGTGRRVVLEEPDTHYFDIFYINEALYFTDWNRKAIMSVPAQGGKVGFLEATRFEQLNGIYIMSSLDVSDCQMGEYGARCEDCGHCYPNSVCDKTTGHCSAGCSPGYTGGQCFEEEDLFWSPTTTTPRPWYRTTGPPKDASMAPSEVCHHGRPALRKVYDNHSRDHVSLQHVILIGTVAGIAVILLIVVVTILTAILLRRKRKEAAPSNNCACATEEVKQPPSLFSVAAELPPAYSSVSEKTVKM